MTPEDQVLAAEIAHEVSMDARRRGRDVPIIRAMIDPAETLVVWRDKRGEIAAGIEPPEGTPEDSILIRCEPGELLVLDHEDAIRLGIPRFDGTPADLGKELGLPGWTSVGSQGIEMMKRGAQEERAQRVKAEARREVDVERNISRRESTARHIERNLKESARWNPTDASYATYSAMWGWAWGWPGAWQTNVWTPESRARWQNRTDACLYYLDRARRGVTTMIQLEGEAGDLGLEPTFASGDLQQMLRDIDLKTQMLLRGRSRIGN
jgi:hypothetical protein